MSFVIIGVSPSSAEASRYAGFLESHLALPVFRLCYRRRIRSTVSVVFPHVLASIYALFECEFTGFTGSVVHDCYFDDLAVPGESVVGTVLAVVGLVCEHQQCPDLIQFFFGWHPWSVVDGDIGQLCTSL